MSAKPTPGPWRLAASVAGYYVHCRRGDMPGEWSKCDTIVDAELGITRFEDARLIAAAPEMLEALREVVEAFDNNVVDAATVEIARAVIAKAEGR